MGKRGNRKSAESSANINKCFHYGELVVLFSCHGLDDSIITSDYHEISKDGIYRMFANANRHDEIIKTIPTSFVFDCCAGNYDARNQMKATQEDDDDFFKKELM